VVEQPDRKLPLIIAFHGAGGDEQMFLYGYGAGRIRVLAEQHGVLIATPETGGFLRSPEAFDRLLESLERDYAIDPDRIYVLGHSLGAAAAGLLARTRANRIAAAATIAGGIGTPTAGPLAPTLVIAAELDRITGGPDRVRQAVAAAREKGLPIEYRLHPNYGHTLIVGQVLPEVFDWLLARRCNVPTSAPASAPN
jgi:predicted esterase